jgi:RNA polymerase sigma-70 factor, ECF subfamily
MAIISLSSSICMSLGIALPFVVMVQSNDEDSALVEAVLGGDPDAYRGLVERYQNRIYNVIYGMVHNREDAMELAQDSFIKAYRKLSTFRLDSKFYTWLCRIAINTAIDDLRKKKNRKTSEFDDNFVTKTDGGVFEGHNQGNPEKEYARKELKHRIIEEVDKLPEDQKQVLVLKEVDGLSYKEIADILGIPQGTVMSRLYYARKRLQEALQDQHS